MKTVALIPARGGSKGLPKKNIKMMAGKPLIAWSIEDALAADFIDDVFVSTDCPEIAAISKEYGAKVPFLRPKEISVDESSTESVMIHFCEFLKKEGHHYDNLILIQATSPIRDKSRFDDALVFYKDQGFDSLVAVAPSHRFFWKNLAAPEASYDIMNRPRRQDITPEEQQYIETGSFYITSIKCFHLYKNRLCGKIGLYVMSEIESFEIDTQFDFDICKSILENRNGY